MEADRVAGRRGYGPRMLLSVLLVKYFFVLPAVTNTLTEIAGNPELIKLCGCASKDDLPSRDAVYRFLRKLRRGDWLAQIMRDVQAAIGQLEPRYGEVTAVDSTDLPAYANGQRRVRQHGPLRTRYSDPDASWGHRGSTSTRAGGGFYGYKLDAIVSAETELPLAWVTRTAKASELPQIPRLLDYAERLGRAPKTLVLDSGYDAAHIYDECHRRRIRLVCPLKPSSKKRNGNLVPTCRHGRHEHLWVYAGTDMKRGPHGAAKYRCPLGLCTPASIWISLDRFHTAIPRETPRSRAMYARRTAVERFWSRLKSEWGLLNLRVRGQDRVAQHAELIVLAYMLFNLAKLRASP